MHYIVALTGGIGSGKTTIANSFATLGVPLVDADVIARQIIQVGNPALRAIVEHFGSIILHADGSLNRSVLRERIFSDPNDKSWLNNLLHPLIQKQTEQQFHSIYSPYVLWVVPLLIENNLQERTNRVLVVDVEPRVQIVRTLTRDNVNRKQVENILKTQVSRQKRLAYADDIIDNSGRSEEITDQVTTLHRYYLTLAASITRKNKST